MKKFAALLMTLMMLTLAVSALADAPTPTSVELSAGTVDVYDFGEIKLYAYLSGDALGDVAYAIETSEGIVMIESTAFAANNEAWKACVGSLDKPVVAKLMAFHPNGSDTYLADLPYATENALANWGEGGDIRALTDSFVAIFGDAVASDHPVDAQIVNFGDTLNLAGIDFVIRNEGDAAYGIEIPAINCVYIHMMGSACHNILTSIAHIDAFIAELSAFDYDLVLTGHNAPEGKDAVAAKIAYLENVKAIAADSADAASFMEAVNAAYPEYAGANYLEMTAGYLFPAAE